MYHDIEVLTGYETAPGLWRIRFDGDEALWTSARARKHTRCAFSDLPIRPGDEVLRPVGNQSYRMYRILAGVVGRIPVAR